MCNLQKVRFDGNSVYLAEGVDLRRMNVGIVMGKGWCSGKPDS